MSNFIEWLEDRKTQKTRLCIFDFDSTIANVPERPARSMSNHKWSDREWDGEDWWASPHSLREPYYQGGINVEVIKAFHQAQSDPSAHVVLLTGRRGVVADSVRRVLHKQGLFGKRIIPQSNQKEIDSHLDKINKGLDIDHPEAKHDQYFSGDFSGENDYPTRENSKKKIVKDHSTLAFKRYIILSLINQNKFEFVEVWDDRDDHIEIFQETLKDLLMKNIIKKAVIHKVIPPLNQYGQATITDINL